jgi:hypothetical protein
MTSMMGARWPWREVYTTKVLLESEEAIIDA